LTSWESIARQDEGGAQSGWLRREEGDAAAQERDLTRQ
jgi:hypothetical protein